MKAYEELKLIGIERCLECNCATGEDWEYIDFSNKALTQCPQCGELIFILEINK